MTRSWILEHIGFTHIVNHKPRSKEIHSVKKLHKNCHVKEMKYGGYCTKVWANFLVKKRQYDFCRWCTNKSKD